jgi:hypothetical protein
MTTAWNIAIDWDRDGVFTDPDDDVSLYTISVEWFLGMKRPYWDTADDSTLKLVLDNQTRRFSPESKRILPGNTPNPLYGKIAPFRTIRIQSNDGTTTRTHWIGWIETIEPDVDVFGKRQVTITASSVMKFFQAAETSIELQENQRSDQIIARLLTEVVVPPALTKGFFLDLPGYGELDLSTKLTSTTVFSVLDVGKTNFAIAADNWVRQRDTSQARQSTFNVYRAIADVVMAERGRFFFDREGRAIFWNRTRLQDDITPAFTLNDSQAPAMNNVRYVYAGTQDFQNEIVVTAHPRAVSASDLDTLWVLDQPVGVGNGETKNIQVRFQDTTTGNIRIGAKNVTLGSVTFSQGSANVTLEVQANSATITIQNTSGQNAVLSSAVVRGRKITDYGQMEATVSDPVSLSAYGRRTLKMNLTSVDDFLYAQQIASFELNRRKTPRGTISEVTLESHGENGGNYHAQQLALTIGSTILIGEYQTQHGYDVSGSVPVFVGRRYLIIGEAHRLTDAAANYETTWYLEPLPETKFPWKLGATNRGELGTNTHLAL